MKKIEIREAVESDRAWVVEIMNSALSTYYDGDHTAHAERILSAHLQGGADKIGFFSFEQKMFIAEIESIPVGMIHIVGKKQNTYKISPLIVAPNERNVGVGEKLLAYVENYIGQKKKIRQLYCTVAETNHAAKRFFEKHGFIRAGSADSQYKLGIAEAMYYKSLDFEMILRELDNGTVSVIELDEAPSGTKEAVRAELLSSLPVSFDGIDDTWVDSLFSGYARRNTGEVNQKYKLIYVAIDQNGMLVGVAGATPKKGAPIKIMPLVAKNRSALIALLTDLPYQLSKYGRKLYIHIDPSVEEVKLLQAKGWIHESDLPEAYRPNIITQQWSYELKSDITRFIRVKEPFLKAIKEGKKTVEVRVGYGTINEIRVGDYINFITYVDYSTVAVNSILRFSSFDELLSEVNYRSIMPWATNQQAVVNTLSCFYPPEKIEKFGLVALCFECKE